MVTDADTDRLLKHNGGLGPRSGVYSEIQLAARADHGRRIARRLELCRRRTVSSMLLEVVAEDINHLPLTDRQKCLFRLALNGCTSCKDIAEWMGLSPSTILAEYRHARRQLGSARVWIWLTLCETFEDPILQSNWPELLKHLSAQRGI